MIKQIYVVARYKRLRVLQHEGAKRPSAAKRGSLAVLQQICGTLLDIIGVSKEISIILHSCKVLQHKIQLTFAPPPFKCCIIAIKQAI